MEDLDQAIGAIRAKREAVPRQRAVLVGVSGIDVSGKGYVTSRMVTWLVEQGVRAVGINADGWLNLPNRRFSETNHPPRHLRNR
jgi:uridine kinase